MYSSLIVGALVVLLLIALDLGSERSGIRWAARHPAVHFSHGPTRLALIASGFFLATLFSVSTIAQTVQRIGLVFVSIPILLTGLGLMLALAYRRALPFRESLPSGVLKPSIQANPIEALLLPRPSGVGYTVNFSHPRARSVMIVFLIAPLLVIAIGVAIG